MSRNLMNEKKLNATFKQYLRKFDESPIFQAKNFLTYMLFALLHAVLAGLVYIKMNVNIVSNIVYVLYGLQCLTFVLILISYLIIMFAIVVNPMDFVSRMTFEKDSNWNKFSVYFNRICGWLYFAALFTANYPIILVSLFVMQAISWLGSFLVKEVTTIAVNKFTQEDLNNIDMLRKERDEKENGVNND